jgi:glycerol-3-phosphate dehydrogenase (NAD(P)+)
MRFGVIGAGAWGTALAHLLADKGEVRLWAREQGLAEAINTSHINALFLPNVPLHENVQARDTLVDVADCDALLVVVPAQFLRATLAHLPDFNKPLILCAKGIEAQSHKLMSEVAVEACPHAPIAVLSGPSFAREVALGLPTAITIACEHADCGERIISSLARPHFRPYYSSDIIGAEIGGAVKNILAIACGVAAGAELGRNAHAALIARGYAEMLRFGLAKGARAETLAGLCGLGDLVLTCSSEQSRNFSLGVALGQGQSAGEFLSSRQSIAEGALSAPVLVEAARATHVEMPVCAAVYDLLQGAPPQKIIAQLLARPLKTEA